MHRGVMVDVNLQDIVVEWDDTESQEQADYAPRGHGRCEPGGLWSSVTL